LLTLVGLGSLGLLVELALLEHWAVRAQFIPLTALALALGGTGTFALRPGRGTLKAFRGTMGLAVVTGVVGIGLHLSDNLAFEREIVPDAGLGELLWAAFHGATPLLAPGALAQLGLVGLVLTYRHPVLSRTSDPDDRKAFPQDESDT
jgi:hypothetical protein